MGALAVPATGWLTAALLASVSCLTAVTGAPIGAASNNGRVCSCSCCPDEMDDQQQAAKLIADNLIFKLQLYCIACFAIPFKSNDNGMALLLTLLTRKACQQAWGKGAAPA